MKRRFMTIFLREPRETTLSMKRDFRQSVGHRDRIYSIFGSKESVGLGICTTRRCCYGAIEALVPFLRSLNSCGRCRLSRGGSYWITGRIPS